jgi:protein TonB
MFRVLIESNAKHIQFSQGSLVSVVAHATLIGAAIFGTGARPANDDMQEADKTQRTAFFMLPPDHVKAASPKQEAVAWRDPGAQAGNGGVELRSVSKDAARPALVQGRGPEEGKTERVSEPTESQPTVPDTVATALEVDSAVARYPESAAPAYPLKLLEQKIEGGAYVQFIVDTTGLADLTSFRVLSSTHPEFAESVRSALPGMRFHPAIMRARKVRQLVEQPFLFKIVPAAAHASAQKPVP